MEQKSSAHYQREYRKRLRDMGLVKKEVWILPENARRLADYERELRLPLNLGVASGQLESAERQQHIEHYEQQKRASLLKGDKSMNDVPQAWTTESLYKALLQTDLATEERAEIELIDGVSPALHLVMYEYGDLPIFLTVAGDQILVESLLWSVSEVNNPSLFNETILRTHKYFPLSTISLDKIDGDDCYHMFGALSARSLLSNIVLEIDVLAANVIQATQAYSDFLDA